MTGEICQIFVFFLLLILKKIFLLCCPKIGNLEGQKSWPSFYNPMSDGLKPSFSSVLFSFEFRIIKAIVKEAPKKIVIF